MNVHARATFTHLCLCGLSEKGPHRTRCEQSYVTVHACGSWAAWAASGPLTMPSPVAARCRCSCVREAVV